MAASRDCDATQRPKCSPKMVSQPRQVWRDCRSFWNVLEQTNSLPTSMCVTHTQTSTCNFSLFKNKNANQKERTNGTKTGWVPEKVKVHFCNCQTVKKQKTKQNHYAPLISQVSLGCSTLFWSVPPDTPWAAPSQMFLDSHWYRDSGPHNGD